MPTVSQPELEGIARGLARDRFDAYAASSLARAYEEFVARRRREVGPVTLTVNGRAYPSFYAALADPAAAFAEGEIRLTKPGEVGPEWEFLLPFERLTFRSDGSADLVPPNGGPARHAIARVLLREHYLLRSRSEEDQGAAGGARRQLPSLIGTIEQGFAICRALPVLPFAVTILLYLAEQRVRFELDLVHTALLSDLRAGRFAASRRVVRTSRISWGVDRKLAKGHLSLLATRCLEVLVESNGLTSVELSHLFGGVRGLVDSALQGLVQQRLATFDHRTGLYHGRLEAFLPSSESTGAAPASFGRSGDAALHTSVQELLAAADARATCPLCGKPLPPGSGDLLCADCSAKVGLA